MRRKACCAGCSAITIGGGARGVNGLRRAGRLAVSLALGPVVAGTALAQPQSQPAPLVTADGRLGEGWRIAGLPEQKLPWTRFLPQRAGDAGAGAEAAGEARPALRIEAEASYGNLALDLAGMAAPARLRWSWRVLQPNAAVDLARKAGDDAAAKVCLAFDLPLARLNLIEQMLLQLARSKTRQPLPAATLCWVWGHAETPGALIPNAFSRRVRYIVLRDGAAAGGPWVDEDRDVRADFLRAFGDESAEVPPLAALIVGADADNTGGRSVALVAGLRFGP